MSRILCLQCVGFILYAYCLLHIVLFPFYLGQAVAKTMQLSFTLFFTTTTVLTIGVAFFILFMAGNISMDVSWIA